jgi:hypothetical protein
MDDFVDGSEADPFDPLVAQRAEEVLYERGVEHDEAIAAHLRRSKEAYGRLFKQGNATADDVAFVMNDLAWFCRAYDPQWCDDPRMQDRFVARREVFQRIAEYVGLSHDTLMKMYAETQHK